MKKSSSNVWEDLGMKIIAITIIAAATAHFAQFGKEIVSDDVTDLPVNSIYELDFGKLEDGEYTVELHSYTEVSKKRLFLK